MEQTTPDSLGVEGRTVLVTGAGGFIGSHLTERLVQEGADVRAFVRYNSRSDRGLLETLPYDVQRKLTIIMGDLRDPSAVRDALNGVEVVFHLGAIISIPYSYIHPREVAETNVLGTLNVLLAAKEIGITRIIHTSTSEVYGTAQYVPIDEKHPLHAQSPYAATKVAADQLAQSFYLSYDLPVVTIRPFNTYGPRQSARAIIPTIIVQALTKDEILLGSMRPRRDLTYVTDIVEGFILAATARGVEGKVINLGTGKDISIGELAELILQIMGKKAEILFDATRIRPSMSEVQQLLADNSNARKLLGWEPSVSLEEGIRRTSEWVSERLALYKPEEYVV